MKITNGRDQMGVTKLACNYKAVLLNYFCTAPIMGRENISRPHSPAIRSLFMKIVLKHVFPGVLQTPFSSPWGICVSLLEKRCYEVTWGDFDHVHGPLLLLLDHDRWRSLVSPMDLLSSKIWSDEHLPVFPVLCKLDVFFNFLLSSSRVSFSQFYTRELRARIPWSRSPVGSQYSNICRTFVPYELPLLH